MVKHFIVRLVASWAVVLVISMTFAAAPVAAQGDAVCAAAFLAEAERLGAACTGLEPGMLCASPAGVSLQQAATGRLTPATGTVSLAGSASLALTSTAAEPGLVVVQLPALEERRSFSAVLWGAARLLDAPAPPRAPMCEARSLGSINVRSEPSTQAAILGQLRPDQLVPITARLEDASWWQIEWNGASAWVFAELTPTQCDPEIMLVYDLETGVVSGGLPTPDFQAVRLETGFADALCPAALQGGALLQSPVGGASWLLNGLRLHLDGTLWLQAPQHDVMAIQVLEGQVAVEAGQVSRVAGVGQLLRIPLRAGVVDGVPGPAMNGLGAGLETLPLAALPRPIDPPAASAPLSDSQEAGQCGVLPQLAQVIPDASGTATFDLVLETAQTIRVSATGAGLARLAVGDVLAAPADAGADFQILPGVALEAGTHRIVASVSGSEPVTVGVTCDLPAVTVADIALRCEDLLLRWDAVQGGSVQFSAPAAARASVIVTHALPSEGPAETLAITGGGAGERLAQAPFAGISGMQVAGPLVISVPETGIYRVEWDGDPFNSAAVEVVCELPPPAEAAEE